MFTLQILREITVQLIELLDRKSHDKKLSCQQKYLKLSTLNSAILLIMAAVGWQKNVV